jgi:hypothetical protein
VACGCGASAGGGEAQSPEHALKAPHARDYPEAMNPMIDLLERQDYAGAAAFLAPHVEACLASKDCTYNAQVLYFNWANAYQNAGDWQGARTTLQSCVEVLHDAGCTERLTDLESRHRF